MPPNTARIDTDGDGKTDARVTIDFDKAAAEVEAKQKAKASKPAQPTKVEGAEPTKLTDDVAQEFTTQKDADHFHIVIPSTQAPNEQKRIPLGVNGVFYTIVRDIEVVVPKCVLDNLDIAEETRYRDKPVEGGRTEKVPYKVKSYPYQKLGGPYTADEAKALNVGFAANAE